MGLFGKKKIIDKIIEYFNDNNSTYIINNGVISFDLYLEKENYSITPYFILTNDDKCLSIKINLRSILKDETSNSKFIFKINNFNNNSKYLVAKTNINTNILFLEYNSFVNYDNVYNVLDSIIDSIYLNQKEINEL